MDMNSGDIESRKGEEIGLMENEKTNHNTVPADSGECSFLTREDLLKLDMKEPVWRRARIGLLIGFWIIWFGLLAASVIIIIVSPKCPPKPTLEFWQGKVGYWLNPFAFKDSDGDLIGDFKGIMEKISYITDEIGAGFIILDSFLSGTFTNTKQKLGLVDNLTEVDAALGSLDDFRSLLRLCRRTGLDVVISLDFNGISLSHPWVKNESYITPASSQTTSRGGESTDVTINGKTFYSVGDKDMVDLNLKNPFVLEELKKVVNFWLSEGVSGILLKNAAFYVEKDVGGSQIIYEQNATNKWFKSFPSSQVFVNESLSIVQAVREVVDKYHKSGSRQKVLIVDAGDTGYGLRDVADDALMFLGTNDNPGAHVVVSREFVRGRGWKTIPTTASWIRSSLSSYDISSNENKSSLLLTTATTSDRIYSDVVGFALTFLLPGTSVVYYGAELNTAYVGSTVPPTSVYPRGKVPFPNLDNRDSALSCYLPMPWDQTGKEFSPAGEKANFTNYLKAFDIKETVQSALSVGRDPTLFNLLKQLVKLRENPSLLWGQFRHIFKDAHGHDVFVREAEGFPSFIIVSVLDPSIGSRVYDFTTVCPQLRNHLVFPPKPTLPQNVALEGDRIYVDAVDGQASLYVFECM